MHWWKKKKTRQKTVGQLFKYFKRILDLNNHILERVAHAERVLSGTYLFDNAFLESFVANVCEEAREVVYNLNSISGEKFLILYDRLDAIKRTLEDFVAGSPGPYGDRIAISYKEISRDLDEIVGAKNANLADLYNNFDIRIPKGFAISVKAYQIFLEKNDIIREVKAVYDRYGISKTTEEYIDAIFSRSEVPSEVSREITKQVEILIGHSRGSRLLAVRSSAIGEDAERSFAGQFTTILNVPPNDVLDAYKQVVKARFKPEVIEYLGDNHDYESIPMAVGVQEMVEAVVSGVVYTDDPSGHNRNCLVISAVEGLGEKLVSGETRSDLYVLSKGFPLSLVSCELTIKNVDQRLPFGETPIDLMNHGLKRGGALLKLVDIKRICETALLCEKAFGTPRDIEWAFDKCRKLIILQNRHLSVTQSLRINEVNYQDILKDKVLLLNGLGHTAQSGIASGTVMQVDSDGDLDAFPVGAIAVAHYAHPKLSRVLKRAGAIITDVGSATGHLATIAREYRVPAILGAGIATEVLKDGMHVTVDAGEKKVFKGIIKELVEMEQKHVLEFWEEPETKTLRRILSYVAPLYMIDPASDEFRPEKCKTIHDIIHFCHEKAVETLIEHFSSHAFISGERVYEFDSSVPLNIRIIDVGSGVVPKDQTHRVSWDEIRCRPFKALFQGLSKEEAWEREPMSFGMGDLLSSMTKPISVLTNPPEYVGQNLAIIAEDYLNLSLLLGYHFNVIDAFVSSDPDNNYIYFRFAGGFAHESKRKKRAELIKWILEAFGFKVELNRDLVVGKLKGLETSTLLKILENIGELIAYTRQLDVRMVDDDAVERFYHQFFDMCFKANWP